MGLYTKQIEAHACKKCGNTLLTLENLKYNSNENDITIYCECGRFLRFHEDNITSEDAENKATTRWNRREVK